MLGWGWVEEDENSLNWVPNQEAFFLVGSWLREGVKNILRGAGFLDFRGGTDHIPYF